MTAGVLAGSAAMIDRMEKVRRRAGTILDPYAAYALGRGLKTLAVRVERQNASALAVAQWLARDRRVGDRVLPRTPESPDHEIARRQMRGFGGMILCRSRWRIRTRRHSSIDFACSSAASLGGVESLCSLPVLTSQWGHTDDELREAGVTRSMARLSVGLEDPQDLIEDLTGARRLAQDRFLRLDPFRAGTFGHFSDARDGWTIERPELLVEA